MKKTALVVLALCVFVVIKAQTSRGRISITIINDQQSALENATVELLKVKDTSIINGGAQINKIDITDIGEQGIRKNHHKHDAVSKFSFFLMEKAENSNPAY